MDLKRSLELNQKGSLTVLVILLTTIIVLTGTALLLSEGNKLTGAVIGVQQIGIQTISGPCNISVKESIINIGHDYECTNTTNGFIIDADNLALDCQDHYIKCVGTGCNEAGFAGILIQNHTNITIQNCYVYNFTDGIKINQNSFANQLLNNYLYNNTDGVDINNATANNVTGNVIENSLACGVNISSTNHSSGDVTQYNNIWNNKIFNNSGGLEACNEAGSYNYWNLGKNCGSSGTNIRGGSCLGGNWWLSYIGKDTSGDGLGDTWQIPYKGGGILQAGLGDNYPLVDACVLPGLINEPTTCPATELNSSSGEGMAIVGNNVVFTCNGTILNGNASSQSPPYADDMRGIEIKNVNNVTVIGCTIYNFTYGVYIENAYNIELINLTVYDNNQTGIYIGSLAYNVTVRDSVIKNRFTSMQNYGIRLLSAKPSGGENHLINNTIYNNTLYGIYLSDSSNTNLITQNTIYNNSDGIFVNDSDGNSIYNNAIYNNANAGIRVLSSNLNDLGGNSLRNTIYGNTYGYLLESTTSTSDDGITGKIYQNTYGIYMNNSDPNIKDVTMYNNSFAGILINNSNPGSQFIEINNVTINGSIYGLYAVDSLKLKLSNDGPNEYYNNSYGIYLLRVNGSQLFGDVSIGEGPTTIHNNTNNILLVNSHLNTFEAVQSYGGLVGFNLTNSTYNNITTSNISMLSSFNLYLNNSNNNSIYNNYIDNSTGGISAYDDSNNRWNTSKQLGTNIIEGSYLGGNWWSQYVNVFGGNDTTGDGIGDVPANFSISGGNNFDFLPLTTTLVTCGNISQSFSLYQNIYANGSCMTVTANNITLNFNGYSLIGNGSGTGVYIPNKTGVVVLNANILNFTTAIYINPSNNINVTNNNFTSNQVGLSLSGTNNSRIFHNWFTNNSLGLNLSQSSNNSIYNNYFNNTDNARDDGSINNWNLSYDCTVSNNSIISGKCSGGNFWGNYLGKDTGGGAYPHNETNDKIGDTNIPYTNSNKITGGDYLPLTSDNGSVDLGCQSVTSNVVLSANVVCLSGDGVVIAANDVTLNCNGKSISGSGIGSGVSVNGKNNVIIKNCNITNFDYGIKIQNSNNVRIIDGNDLRTNDFYGVYLYKNVNTTINGNTLISDNNGVYSIESTNNIITNNTINLQKKFYGIYLFNSEVNRIENNTMWDNYHGIYLVNSSYTNVTNTNISSSDVYSLFVHKSTANSYFRDNLLLTGKEAIRIKENSNSNQFIGNTVQEHSDYGVYSTDSSSNTFTNNSFVNNSANIYLSNSTSYTFNNNTITTSNTGLQAISNSNSLALINNTLNSSTSPSLEINDSTSAVIRDNRIYNNAHLNNADSATLNSNNTITQNLNLSSSDNVIVSSNSLQYVNIKTATGTTFNSNTLQQLYVNSFSSGNISSNTIANNNLTVFELNGVSSSDIHSNNIQNVSIAVLLKNSSNNNNIYDNWLKDNGLGLNISSSTGNKAYNNYFKNTRNVADDSGNYWNTSYSCSSPNIVGGPCKGGNFYSNYYGLDNGANGRNQGDGIGDQPATYSISPSGIADSLPLVLYVARQYFAPTSGTAASMTAMGNISGTLSNGEVVPNEVQTINYTTSNLAYVGVLGLFNQSDVHAETLKIDYNANKTAINKTGVTGLSADYSLYLHHNNGFDAGVYLCPGLFNLSQANSTCSGRINLTSLGWTNGINLSITSTSYRISNLTNNGMTAVLSNDGSSCGGNILHDVTFTGNLNCNLSGAALTVAANGITINMAGYSLTGNGSGIGINISNKTGVTVINGNIVNFSKAIYVDPSTGINISNNNISNSAIGVEFFQINHSYMTSNRIFSNTLGLNLSQSYNNTIYNNYLNNTNNAVDDGNNRWNISQASGTNIIGGTYLGGNFWSNYNGWDTDLEGLGETLLPWNSSDNITTGGDSLPLTEVGKIACGGSTQDVLTNVTLNRNVTSDGLGAACFTIGANNLTFDCNGYTLIGNQTTLGILALTKTGTIIKNCNLKNFTTGFYISFGSLNTVKDSKIFDNVAVGIYNHLSTNNTFQNNTVYNNTDGNIYLDNSNNSFVYNNTIYNGTLGIVLGASFDNRIYTNTITNNSLGINLTSSYNNTIYNNYFNNTNNAIDNGTNYWNTTYACSSSTVNILGDNCTGGNFWSNYNGSDDGNATLAGIPNVSNDGVGDTLVPYNNSNNFTGGDYLPLLSTSVCGDGQITGTEVCDGSNFNGLTCSSYGSNSGSLACTNSCQTISTASCTNATSSSSSTGGGGGGGGGISTKMQCNDKKDNDNDGKIDYPDDPGCESANDNDETDLPKCTQSWQCGSWSACISGQETRECYDLNDCVDKKAAGEVGEVIYTTIPLKSRSCEVIVAPISEKPSPPTTKYPEFIPEAITKPGPIRTITLSSLALLVALGGIYIYWQLGYAPNRLRRKLKKLSVEVDEEYYDLLKKDYLGIYNLYLKVSEKKKQNFFSQVTRIREKIEENLKAEKEIEKMLERADEGNLEERKKNYLKIYKDYQKLPEKVRQRYYAHIVQLRDRLERGN
ncbi:MAG: right-handed parallel beta-helix repeat-containing protein [Nanoarchaeota archaeon]|nr:right-handed parallel beta-helix repeat-containing protein [Nanoarchaeota archaeon]MBU1644049.1 right-handed parallel beta-helix repeat-containing protein [Nanoarchaeota archaeon]MBU1977291.1 right-handed parallel beta-helix repeat-containing protein [Nanoarchaeota archaeon]